MKVGNIVDGLAVIDVKRVNKMNLIQFTKAVSEYIEQGYKLDVHSSRQVGLVLSVDLYKLESNLSGNVGSVGEGVGSTGEAVEFDQDKILEDLLAKEVTIEYKGDTVTVDDILNSSSVGDNLKEEVIKEPNETTIEAIQESTEKLEAIEPVETVTEDTLVDVKEAVEETEEEEKDGADVEQTPPVKKATRTKKQTT